jgi:nucleotide-binding universal stress UspA family protein
MRVIKKILVPTDFSETAQNAFAYALHLADSVGAELHLLHCVYPGMAVSEVPTYGADITGKLLDVARSNMQEFAQTESARWSSELKSKPTIVQKVEIGGAISTTRMIAEEEHFDLIVVGTHGAHDNWEHLFGTRASGILVDASCPVLVIPENATFSPYKKFCFATDLNHFDALCGSAVVHAFAPMQPDLHFLHVRTKDTENRLLDVGLIQLSYARQQVDFKVEITEMMAKNVAEAIIENARKMDSDLIVMTRHEYNFFEQLFHKSFTREVALQTSRPLLVLNEGAELTPGFD